LADIFLSLRHAGAMFSANAQHPSNKAIREVMSARAVSNKSARASASGYARQDCYNGGSINEYQAVSLRSS
jgi:hypothetical protein